MCLRCLSLFLFPTLLLGATPKAAVQVTAHVPLVMEVEGPGQVVLAPGEVVRIPVSVAANLPWILGVHSPNAWVREPATVSGPAGGANANRREVEVVCSSQATGPQTIALVYTLLPR